MEEKRYKTPEYTRRAAKKYRDKKEKILLMLEPGTVERLRAYGESATGVARRLVLEGLDRLEAENTI